MQGSGSGARCLAAVVLAAAVGALGLAGCVEQPTPSPSPTGEVTPSPTPTVEPEIDLDGTAAQNQDYFDLVNQRLIAAGGTLDGRAFIDNLVAAGYPRVDMELTPDRTAINGAADNIQFSIRFESTCLIGQYGNVGYTSSYAPLLGTDRCLVGVTRPIDWDAGA